MKELTKARILVLLITGLILISCSSTDMVTAQSESGAIILNPVVISLTMDTNGTTYFTLETHVHNTGLASISEITLHVDSFDTHFVSASVEGQSVTALVSQEIRHTSVTIPFPVELSTNESFFVRVELKANDLQSNIILEDEGAFYNADFLYYLRPNNEMQNISLRILLPRHASLSPNSVVPVYPEPDYNATDGFSLLFTWETNLLQPGQEKVFIIKYRFPNVTPAQTVVVFTLQILSVIVGVVLGIILTFGVPRLVERFKRIGEVRIVGVTGEEEEVLDIIRQKGGSCPQKDLYTEMNMSQSKVSIILTNLEERGLIKRFRDGRENMVHILEE